MKKIILIIAVFNAVNLTAAGIPQGLSVHVSTGYNPTGMGLTKFMNKPIDSNVDAATYTSSYFGTKLYPAMSSLENQDVFNSTDSQNSWSTGSVISAGLKWNFFKMLFMKTEFTYDSNRYLPVV